MGRLMVQGTGSDVGKSLLVAGLCRLFTNRGLVVRPFKPQNMSNNAGVAEGGEIGRAQMLQAEACRVAPSVHMNPVLLKPEADRRSQLVVRGELAGTVWFRANRAALLDLVLDSWRRLEAQAHLVLVEGAGSPAETNLRAGDIANMGFARAAGVPVVLVGDIDRGAVIASLVGTHSVLDPADCALIRAFLINRFRGLALFREGMDKIARRTGWEALGIVPWLEAARLLPAEDAVVLDRPAPAQAGRLEIAVPMLPRIANFEDLDPLAAEPAVSLTMVPPGRPIPASARLVILPRSKAVIADLAFLRAEGWDIDILAHRRRGGHVLGLCGGYQMLGRMVHDPHGLEGPAGSAPGLGLFPAETMLMPGKTARETNATCLLHGMPVTGYEIHVGVTTGDAAPLLRLADGRTDGAISADGRVAGTYVHGLFNRGETRAAWLRRLGAPSTGRDQGAIVDAALDSVAEVLARALDPDWLLALAREGRRPC
ncbi:cobyric acid synthase [Thermaurantiacus sp.]